MVDRLALNQIVEVRVLDPEHFMGRLTNWTSPKVVILAYLGSNPSRPPIAT